MKNKVPVRQKIRETIEEAKMIAGITAAVGTVYAGVVLAVNAFAMPIILGYNALERAVGGKEVHSTATLLEEKAYRSPNMNIAYGKFRTDDGHELTLYNTCDFPSYKFLSNRQIPKAEVGKKYNLTSLEGPISNKILNLREVN